jgi:DNA-directed RNA polymerase subunit RPC12/RpoP
MQHVCPECSSNNIERVHRHSVRDRLRGVFGWRVYRCRECGARFYGRPMERKAS